MDDDDYSASSRCNSVNSGEDCVCGDVSRSKQGLGRVSELSASTLEAESASSGFSELSSNSAGGSVKKRGTQYIINVPVEHFKKMTNTDGIHSLSKETQLFVGITTIHGPLRIYRGHGIYRFLWLLATVMCTAFCIWQVNLLINNYLQKPTTSEMSFQFPDKGMELPIVTICSYNNVRKSFVEMLNKTSHGAFRNELLDYMGASYLDPQLIMAIANNSDAVYELGEEAMANFTESIDFPFDINSFFFEAGPVCNETLKVCVFAGTIFDCCQFTESVLTDLGKCFRVDLKKVTSLPSTVQIQSGMSNGLQIYADYHTEERIDQLNTTMDPLMKLLDSYLGKTRRLSTEAYGIFAQTIDDGFRVYIHSDKDLALTSTQGVTVAPSNRLYSSISSTKYQLLPLESWGSCIHKWPMQVPAMGTYSVAKCKALCRAKYYNDHCGCSPFVYNIDKKYAVCSAFEVFQCVQTIFDKTTSEQSLPVPNPDCSFCKVECDRWDYHTFDSFSEGIQTGTAMWLQRLVPNETIARIQSNYVSVNVYHREMAYTQYHEVQSTTFTQTISNIGGTMGMCLGISFISIIEIIVYLWKSSWVFISKKRRNYLIKKRFEEQEREKSLNLTLQNISSRHSMGDYHEHYAPSSPFRRVARSLRRKVSVVFPRKDTLEQTIVDDNLLEQRLHGTGKTNFDKVDRKDTFVELKLNQSQVAQLLKDGTVDTEQADRRPRSRSCPAKDEDMDWRKKITNVVTAAAAVSVQPTVAKIDEVEDNVSSFDSSA